MLKVSSQAEAASGAHGTPPPRRVHTPTTTPAVDLLRWPLLGPLLRWRHARTLSQIPLFVVAAVMIAHGLAGPQLAPKNLATTLTWVHFRGALVLVLLLAGNFFCMACPFMLPRNLARRFINPKRNWPRRLRNKWLSLSLFVTILFAYELFDLWSSPWWTAVLIALYFAGALAVDGLFKHASFCKFVCPVGQFNFVASTVSPLEVKVRDLNVCEGCRTKDCIRGRRETPQSPVVIQRGCELALFQPRKVGNLDCTFCLDCVQACPHDNVGILSRVPAEELTVDPVRSGVGRLSQRRDLSALAVVFTFGALLNAFGMVSPVYALQGWLAGVLRTQSEATVLATLFALALVVEPVVLLGAAGWLTLKWGGARGGLLPTVVKYSYALIPLGFGVWLSHYGFHFLTGLYTFIPVTQNALAGAGWPLLGEPLWSLTGLPERVVYPLELGLLGLGLLGSLLLAYRLAEADSAAHPRRIFAAWAALCLMLWASALWLLSQPMEMRGTFLGG
ncbi:MAG: 4Fe-4S binding protein [Pyrinomonadaceae bacterium]